MLAEFIDPAILGFISLIIWVVFTLDAGGSVSICSAIDTAVGIKSSLSTIRLIKPISWNL